MKFILDENCLQGNKVGLGRRISLATSRDGSTWDTSSWMRDPATGLCTSKTYADGSSVAYTHTPDGLPLRTTWARGVWRESAYDAARREIGRHYSDPSLDCAFERDVFGALSSASNAVAQTAFLRDNPGMPTNETHAIAGDSFAIRRAYDANGRLASLEWAADGDAASRRVAFAYDGEGRLSTVSNESFSASYAYHAHGHELGYTLTLSSGAKVVRSVSRLTRPPNTVTAVTNFFVSASGETNALPSFAYALDDLLRPVARNADSFGYDARSQLMSATLRSAQTNAYAYAYDNARNRTAAAEAGIATSYTANSLNQYTAVSSDVPAYDADGNLLALGDWSYAWDAENRLATAGPTAPEDGSLRVRNEYDAFSRRVVKRVDRWHDGTGEWRPWETHAFLYDGWNVVREEVRDESGTLTTTLDYHWGRDLSGTLQGAGGVGGLLAYTRNGALRIPLHDHLGNVVAVVDDGGVPVAAYEYDPFGNIVSSSGPEADAVPFRFSTKYFDSETGLYYYGYRFYSPELGRWINRDPIEEECGENLYGFGKNSPLSAFDRLGKDIYLVQGNESGNVVNDTFHQSVCVDEWGVRGVGQKTCGRRCYSFATTWKLRAFPRKFIWLGWFSYTPAGVWMEGKIYDHEFVGTVLKTKKTSRWQDQAWNGYMNHRMNTTDVYSVLHHNCRLFSQLEFADAPGH